MDSASTQNQGHALETLDPPDPGSSAREVDSPANAWHLVGKFTDQDALRSIAIDAVLFSVGRNESSSLCIPNNTVSMRHAELRQVRDDLVVQDMKSRNGTYLNGNGIDTPTAVNVGDVLQFGTAGFKVTRGACPLPTLTESHRIGDELRAVSQFKRMIFERAVIAYYQPIVDIATRAVVGYEVRGRSPLFGLESAEALFRAATYSQSEVSLGELLRAEGLSGADDFSPTDVVFLNTHPLEVGRPRLVQSMTKLRRESRRRPITLQVPNVQVDLGLLKKLRADLSEIDVGFAYDGFDADEERLLELIELRPDYVKFQMRLLREIHKASSAWHFVISTAVNRLRDAGIPSIALGVESSDEHESLRDLGFEFAEGYYYGEPKCREGINDQIPAFTKPKNASDNADTQE